MLIALFDSIPDHRRKEGKMYDLPHLLLFSILGILSGAVSYRQLHSFMKLRFPVLKEVFGVKWRRAPAYNTIRTILQGVDKKALEEGLRKHSLEIAQLAPEEFRFLGVDGKTLKGSFDHFEDQKAVQLLSVFLSGKDIILAHEEIGDEKTNEIPVAQRLIEELGLTDCVFTLDALHCQKKPSGKSGGRETTLSSR